MRWEQQVQYASLSDIGFRRRNNQDSSVVQICSERDVWNRSGHLFMVADGMGGHAVGELASKIAADTVPHVFFKTGDQPVADALKTAVEFANAAIYERGSQNRDFERMGTTCSALVLSPAGAVIGHVGDSRVYRIRGSRIDQLTFDHSLQWELLRQGKLPAEDIFLHEPRHVITRSLGPEPQVNVDLEGPYPVLPGDTYVICSDGLTGHVNDSEIGQVADRLPPGDACRLLVHLANLRGGSDNITVVIIRVGELPEHLPELDRELSPAAEQSGLSWRWLATFWAVAVILVLSVSLVLFGKLVAGTLLAGGTVIALTIIVMVWASRQPKTPKNTSDAETLYWRPYRSASAQMTRKFLSHLSAIEAELQRTAIEEGWPIDWAAHEAAFAEVRSALQQKQYDQALAALARSIDILMVGVHVQRKQTAHAARWGKNAPSTDENSKQPG